LDTAYDVADRLTKITNSADAKAVNYLYDNADRMTKETLPNGIATTYNYNGMSRLTKLKDAKGTTTLFDRNYVYNTANQINQIAEPMQIRNFAYDNVDRLTGMTNGTANESYTFDGVGNRTSSHKSASYGYQPFNKVVSTATANYNYDANGNLTTKGEGTNFWRYGFDYENRLISASTRKQTVRYKYDALGRRVQRFLFANKENTKFIYDGQDVVADDNFGTLTKYQNGLGIDNKLKVSTGGTAKYFLADHLGSTNALTNSSGAMLEQTAYDSFGNATNASFPTRYQFTGREYDNFTGLQYSRARWYDAQLGRFISEDPIGFAGGDVNLYGYVKNKSLSRRDPMGLDDADREFRNTDQYKELERLGNEFWGEIRKLPKKPECGPAGSPIIEWLVPDSVGGPFGPFGSKYKTTPPCEAHDTCYSTCGKSKAKCDIQLGEDIRDACLTQGSAPRAGNFYGNGYYWGVHLLGDGAYQSAQEQSGCQIVPFTSDPCSKYGSWTCK
jgi:RHS repeat-associated protein